jgi:hypothetical protein
MSLFFRKSALSWSLAMALPAVAFGQTGYTTNGGEYLIAGSLPGDQTHPQLSLSASGGYLVWEDNSINNAGFTVEGVALDSSFSRVLAPFRISQAAPGNQERPQVALLNNGGAAFVWQGGASGGQHIYARFSSATNAWVGGDVRVSTPANNFQINPAVATLTNGNVAVVWGSLNQYSSSSMQDVYGRILTPTGTSGSAEFMANQFTAYNQRNPAVAALAGGGFVVVWVSEQQRAQMGDAITNQYILASQVPKPSVDIYGRLFNADGSAASDEFLVNSSLDFCATPRVAAASDGSFIVVWAQKSVASSTNGWDILARPFSASSASSGGAVQTVNATLFGDQFLPQISALGTNYLVVWTDLGHDGDREGVFGRFLGGDGTPQSGEFLVNTTTISRQMQPAVAGDNLGRFVAVWTSYVGGANGFDLEAQGYASAGFVPPQLVSAYQPVPALAGDDSGDHSANVGSSLVGVGPVLQYPGGGVAWLTNGTGANLSADVYNGLFYEDGGVAIRSAGFVTVKTSAKGSYSGKLVLAAHSYSLSGRFTNGVTAKSIRRGSGLANLVVQLQLDPSGGDMLRGTVQAGTDWTSDIYANRQMRAKSADAAVQPGKYTLIVPPDGSVANGLAGYGFGTITLSSAGGLRFGAALADGTKVTQSTGVSKDGIWPMFSSLYSGGGLFVGWVEFSTNEPDSDCAGSATWIKPATLAAKYHPAGGFTNEMTAMGSLYTPRLLGGSLLLSGGGLNPELKSAVRFDAQNKVVSDLGKNLSLSVTLSSGLFKGSVATSGKNKVSFQGALFEKSSVGAGYFLGTNQQSGEVYLDPSL